MGSVHKKAVAVPCVPVARFHIFIVAVEFHYNIVIALLLVLKLQSFGCLLTNNHIQVNTAMRFM